MTLDVAKILESIGAVHRNGHFVYTSGKHGDIYVDKAALFPYADKTAQVCKMMAEKCSDLEIDTVAAPALAGVVLTQWVGYYLSEIKGKTIHAVFAEKDGRGGFLFKRGYNKYIKGSKVLVLEDIAATGTTAKKVVDLVRENEGEVVGVCAIINRDPQRINDKLFEAPMRYLDEVPAKAYDVEDLPDEIKSRPVNTKLGHGKEYLAKIAQ